MNIRTLLDIYTSDSISAIRRKIERSEVEKEDKQQEQQQIQAEAEQSVRQADTELKMFEINSKNTIEKEKMQNAIELKILDIEGTRDLRDTEINDDDVNDNGIKDELDQQKIKLMEMKAKMDNSIKKDQLVETKRHNKQTEQISRIKPKVTKK
jgi:hypothetical protein